MSYRQIRDAQKEFWPDVQKSLDHHTRLRKLAETRPEDCSVGQLARARKPWTRVVADETVWAIARADRLESPANGDVIAAARAWAEAWDDDEDGPPALGRDDPADVALYNAVKNLG